MARVVRFLRFLPAIFLILGAFASLAPVSPVLAATVTGCPATESDLQTAITNAGPGGTVQFACSSPTTINFNGGPGNTGPITISQNVTLDASTSAVPVTFDGGNAVQLFYVNSGVTFGLISLTLAHGNSTAASGGAGGAIDNNGTVTITNSTLSDNTATGSTNYGGAIYNTGTITITNSTLSGNTAAGDGFGANQGGGIYNWGGTITITNSTLSGNSASGGGAIDNVESTPADTPSVLTITNSTFSGNSANDGGAIGNLGSTLDITNSTLSGNTASCSVSRRALGTGPAICTAEGGAIYNRSVITTHGTVTITNSTLSGNQVTCSASSSVGGLAFCHARGGAIENQDTVTITNSTLSGNSAGSGGAVANVFGTENVGATIIANNAGGNCYNDESTVNDWGYNLEDDAADTCGFSSANHDLVGVDPKLDPAGLQNNGGPTKTIALLPTSPAIDQIPTTYDIPSTTTPLCPTTDQRGEPRPDDPTETACDIGAYEFQGDTTTALVSSSTNNTSTTGQQVTFTATVSPSDDSPTPTRTVTFTDTTTNTTLCSGVSLDSNGQAICKTSSLSAGTHTITATYTPTTGTDFTGSTGTLTQDVSTTVPNGRSAYDIESSNWSCSSGGITCIPPADTDASDCATMTPCPGARYGDVEAFGPATNATNGIPDELILACVQGTSTGYQIGYLDVLSHQGNLDYPGGVYGTADSGTITGKGTLIGGGGLESNSSQPSSVDASAYDLTTGIMGSVSGIQNTDNGSDAPDSGGFRITIRGKLWTVTNGQTPVRDTTSTTMSCTVGGSQANDLANAGLDSTAWAEGELETSLGDNFFLQSLVPPAPTT